MNQIMSVTIPSRDDLAIELAYKAIHANAEYNLLVSVAADYVTWDTGTEAAINRSLEELDAACVALAAVPTTTLAGQQAKASVLLIVSRTTSTSGLGAGEDSELSLSLLEDIIGRENLARGTSFIDEVLRNGGRGSDLKSH